MILKNGKRLDGCSDTVPVGTINPYIGSIAPYGYLICEGQLVSKITYKELYEICGDKFGTGTEAEFRLPDLRGKTITGYKEGDSTFGTLGALIGNLTHIHSTGNHTLTIDEMPEHTHSVEDNCDTGATRAARRALYSYNAGTKTGWGSPFIKSAGGSQPHNHGNTGESSNLQPSINMNWIVKAFLLMPNQSYVENSLSSTSEINSLSAAKGKELNERFNNYSLLNTTPQTPESNTKISWLQLGYNDRWLLYLKGNTDGVDKDFYIELSETADKKDTGWLPVTFETNYSNYSNYEPCCYRVKGNQIFFKGLVNCGQASAKCGDNICRFDTQYAPTKARYFTVCTSTAETGNAYEHSPAAITVQPSGIIRFHNVPVSGWISLEQITYFLD